MRRVPILLLVLALAVAAAPAGCAGPEAAASSPPPDADLLARVLAIEMGQATLHFATRPGVWGEGGSICVEDDDTDWQRPRRYRQGPLHLRLDFADGRLVELAFDVGQPPPAGSGRELALGELAPARASTLLLDLAERVPGPAAEDLILPATLARDVETWPRLLALARNPALAADLREQAVFWLGQDAAQAAGEGLTAILADDDADLVLREQAIFALSLREGEAALTPLLRIARESPHPQLREKALFWLAQRDDPRVLALFEDILLAR